jgi:hypothetical protein
VGDGALEMGSSCLLAVGFPSHLGDMGVTDLGNDHGISPYALLGKRLLLALRTGVW